MRTPEDLQGITHLGSQKTQYRSDYAPEVLEAFHEDCVNVIMKDLIKLMQPKYIEVFGEFTPRGGIAIHPFANHGQPGTPFEQLARERLFAYDRP